MNSLDHDVFCAHFMIYVLFVSICRLNFGGAKEVEKRASPILTGVVVRVRPMLWVIKWSMKSALSPVIVPGLSCDGGTVKCYHNPRWQGEPCNAINKCGTGLSCNIWKLKCEKTTRSPTARPTFKPTARPTVKPTASPTVSTKDFLSNMFARNKPQLTSNYQFHSDFILHHYGRLLWWFKR